MAIMHIYNLIVINMHFGHKMPPCTSNTRRQPAIIQKKGH